MLVIAIIFIALRFYVRSTLRQPPYLTDWLCLVSYLVFVAYAAVIFNRKRYPKVKSRREIPSSN